MEIISIAGYTEEDKLHIAKRYLVPRQLERNGVGKDRLSINDGALRLLIESYTREAGVRSLERQIGSIARKFARMLAEDEKTRLTVDKKRVPEFLGKPKVFRETKRRTSEPGVSTGLAWTPTGGDILFIEARAMPGSGRLLLTGQLGDVMKESAQAALTFVRGVTDTLGADATYFRKHDIHVHVPAGAVPKDGPSAGVAMAVALASMASGRTVDPSVAMTGEVTLTGQVLPVGGIKEKVLAAKAAGISRVYLPDRNEADIAEIKDEVLEGMEFRYIGHVARVLGEVLLPGKSRGGGAGKSSATAPPAGAVAGRGQAGGAAKGAGAAPNAAAGVRMGAGAARGASLGAGAAVGVRLGAAKSVSDRGTVTAAARTVQARAAAVAPAATQARTKRTPKRREPATTVRSGAATKKGSFASPAAGEVAATERGSSASPAAGEAAATPSAAYVQLEHAADVFLEIWGQDLTTLFRNALFALYDQLVRHEGIEEREKITVEAEAPTLSEALRSLLSEALFHFSAEGFVAARAEVTVEPRDGTTTVRAAAQLSGEKLDRERHILLTEVKAVTYHRLTVEETDEGGWRATVLLDV
jgi:SHS2 domain-containing protein